MLLPLLVGEVDLEDDLELEVPLPLPLDLDFELGIETDSNLPIGFGVDEVESDEFDRGNVRSGEGKGTDLLGGEMISNGSAEDSRPESFGLFTSRYLPMIRLSPFTLQI